MALRHTSSSHTRPRRLPSGVDGVVGRDQLESAIKSSSDDIYVASLDHDGVYQRVFDSKLVKSGMFRANRTEELLVLASRAWPRALLISLESSTTDPKGDKPKLREASANRQAFFARLWGEAADAPLYGGDDSLVCRLGQSEGMAALTAALDARPKRSVPCADEPPRAVASLPPSASAAAPPPNAPPPAAPMRPPQLSATAPPTSRTAAAPPPNAPPPTRPPISSAIAPPASRAAAPPPPAAAPPVPASSGGRPRKRKPIPSMTTPGQKGGFAAGLKLHVHDQNVADATIADD